MMHSRILVPLLALTLALSGSEAFAPRSPFSKQRTPPKTGTCQVLPEAIDSFYANSPYLAAFLTCSIKACAADALAQVQAQPSGQDANIDWKRNLSFFTYGGLYQGMTQQFLYSSLFPAVFGNDHSLQSIASQVGTEVFLLAPFFCMPLVYSIKSILTAAAERTLEDSVQMGLNKYGQDILHQGLWLKYWSIWIPAQTFNFTMVPDHLRVAFVAAVSFGWMFLLSTVSSSSSTEDHGTHEPQLVPASLPIAPLQVAEPQRGFAG